MTDWIIVPLVIVGALCLGMYWIAKIMQEIE